MSLTRFDNTLKMRAGHPGTASTHEKPMTQKSDDARILRSHSMASTSHPYHRWACAAVAVATIAWTAVVPTATATAANASAPATPPSAAIPAKAWTHQQVEFIRSKQLEGGAILSTGTRISPYFANIAASGLIAANTTASRASALKWMQWYLGHLNVAATNVPANSVFDYVYDPVARTETPTGDFDSVDSYASTTLNLAYEAYTSGDVKLKRHVTTNIGAYEAIANILTNGSPTGARIPAGSPDADLTIAKPSYPIAYTMDNVEVYAGLADFARLEALLGRKAASVDYGSWAGTTKNAIVAKLWNPTNGNWDWAFANPSNTSNFYPQATVQLWPIIYGVVKPTDPKAISSWAQFSASYPKWYSGATPDSYPWVSMARAAEVMGETTHATDYLANVHSRYAPGFTQPSSCGNVICGDWYDDEAGWFILAATALDRHHVGD